MRLLCDEDIGTGVPEALAAVGLDAVSIHKIGFRGAEDQVWLEVAGQNGWLVLSCNRRMLSNAEERQAILDHRVGIIYFTQQQTPRPVLLRLLLVKWRTLEQLDIQVPRPFARFLSPNGRLAARYRGRQL